MIVEIDLTDAKIKKIRQKGSVPWVFFEHADSPDGATFLCLAYGEVRLKLTMEQSIALGEHFEACQIQVGDDIQRKEYAPGPETI